MLSKSKALAEAIKVLASITSPYDFKVQLKKWSYRHTTIIKTSGMPLVNINDEIEYIISTTRDPEYCKNGKTINKRAYGALAAENKISYVKDTISDLIEDTSNHGGLYGFSVNVLKVGKDMV